MFHTGDLQSGIALAVQNMKAVVCFVRDDSDLSAKWEKEYLAETELQDKLKAEAISLRIEAGSEEAGFLTPFCPVNEVPFLLVIRNGAVRAFIKPDASAELLQSQLADSLTSQPIVPNAATPPPNQDPPQVESRPTEAQIFVDQHQTQSAPLPSPATPISESSRTPVPARAIPEPAPTSSSLDKGKGKATDTVEEERKAKRLAAQKAQLERIRAEKAERDRILKQVKQDQIDRRKREQEQKAHQVKEEKTAAVQAKRSAPVNEVRISVRIFDGSSLRKTFAPTDTIHQEVRSWIDSNRPDGNAPYTLKQILTPQPSRSITLSEEGQTLGDLELGRTANLVMVPVKEYSDAYVGAGSGLAMKAASAGYGLVSGAVGLASGAVGSLLGWGGQAANSSSSSADSTSGGDTQTVPGNTSGGIKVRTLGQIRSEQRDQQFYNGNQTNFQPRRDEGKDE